MKGTDGDRTQLLAKALAEERTKAEQHLWREMEKHGLTKADGWRIVEFTREAQGGTEIVLRPLHLYLPSPPGLECVVGVMDRPGGIQSECAPSRRR